MVRPITNNATIPCCRSVQVAGHDLTASKATTINPGDRIIVKTNIHIKCPKGTYQRIAPCSGLAIKHGIDVGEGVIDRDCCGEVKVILFNQGKTQFVVNKGNRIAQIIFKQIDETPITTTTEILMNMDQADKGFGSTVTTTSSQPAISATDCEMEQQPQTTTARQPSWKPFIGTNTKT